MTKQEYLTKDEQFKDVLNIEEISRIQDPELREIRSRYWNEVHKAFLDERGIPDCELETIFNKIKTDEQRELQEYEKRHNL